MEKHPTISRRERNEEKRSSVFRAIKQLDDIITSEYLELRGGKVVNKQLQGGEFVPRKGVPCWHENDTKRVMEIQYRYRRGDWSGPQDRSIPIDRTNRVALAVTLSASYLLDLADFIAFQGGDPDLVESLRSQASNALTTGDVAVIYGPGISERYSTVEEDKTHSRGYTYFFFLEDGTLNSSPPPDRPAHPTEDQTSQDKAG